MKTHTTKTKSKWILCAFLLLGLCVPIHAQRHIPKHPQKWIHTGIASFYAHRFNGQLTSTGEIFSNKKMTAASNTLPLNTYVKVTNKRNGKWVVVRINDRMNMHNKRAIDLSRTAAKQLGMIHRGIAKVKIEVVPQAFYTFFNVTPQEVLIAANKQQGNPKSDI